MVMTEDERRLTAYHEAGHAIVGLRVPGNDPLHKVTIIPRGRALGVTINLPERDRYAMRKSDILARLAMMFGGRVAEELIFGRDHVTTDAGNDIQQATELARRMVTEWGMSDLLGRLRYAGGDEQVFLGRSIGRTQNVSEETAKLFDEEAHRIIGDAENTARATLTTDLQGLHAVAEGLLSYETLSGDEVRGLLAGDPVSRPDVPEDDRPPGGRVSPPAEPRKPVRPRPVVGPPQVQPQA